MRFIRPPLAGKTTFVSATRRWRVSQPLLEVFRKLEEPDAIPKNQETFTYYELTRLLTTYVLRNHERLFDQTNIFVCNVGDDPLGRAFGMRAFHRSQAGMLLRQHMLPLDADRPTTSRSVQTGE